MEEARNLLTSAEIARTHAALRYAIDSTDIDPLNVTLYGSFAWGEPTENSDLDVLVVGHLPDRAAFVESIRQATSKYVDLKHCASGVEWVRVVRSAPAWNHDIVHHGVHLHGAPLRGLLDGWAPPVLGRAEWAQANAWERLSTGDALVRGQGVSEPLAAIYYSNALTLGMFGKLHRTDAVAQLAATGHGELAELLDAVHSNAATPEGGGLRARLREAAAEALAGQPDPLAAWKESLRATKATDVDTTYRSAGLLEDSPSVGVGSFWKRLSSEFFRR